MSPNDSNEFEKSIDKESPQPEEDRQQTKADDIPKPLTSSPSNVTKIFESKENPPAIPDPSNATKVFEGNNSAATPNPSNVTKAFEASENSHSSRNSSNPTMEFEAKGNPSGTLAQKGTPAILRDPSSSLPQIDGFEVAEELARGGMGVVFTALDLRLDREVAIKTLLPGLNLSAIAEQRFVIEAHVTARLPHPGIPPVYALGKLTDGRPFMAMKLIRGKTLAAILEDREKHSFDWLQLFEQICQAVGFAHAQGVIHRDLKPLNVMVGAFGEVQVMDWGVAKVLRSASSDSPKDEATTYDRVDSPEHSRPDETRAGVVLGTPGYMPPEQARGDVDKVDARSDVFALGGILCYILTGHAPYTGRTTEYVLRRAGKGDLAEAFADLDSCGADGEVLELAKSCLSVEMAVRPGDGGAVAALVAAYRTRVAERLQAAERERAAAEARAAEEANTRREVEAKLIEQRRRRRAQLIMAGAVLFAMLSVGTGFGYYYYRQNQDLIAAAKREQALAGIREQATNRLGAAEKALRGRDWSGGRAVADEVLALVGEEPKLDDLKERAQSFKTASENMEHFTEQHDQLMYHAILAQEGDRLSHEQKARAAARTGLQIYGLSDGGIVPSEPEWGNGVLNQETRQWLIERCYEMYLVWAELEAANLTSTPEEQKIQLKMALNLLDRAASLGPTTKSCHLCRARMFQALNEVQDSNREQRVADSLMPSGVIDHFLLGVAANRAGKFEEAMQNLKKVLEHQPNHFWANYYLAGCYLRLLPRQYDRALAPLTTCVQLKPRFIWPRLLRGLANSELNHFEEASADFAAAENMETLEPDELARYSLLVSRAVAQLRNGVSRQNRATALQTSDKSTAAAESKLADELFKEAIANLNRASVLRPKQPQTYENLAEAYLKCGKSREALAQLDKAIQLVPTASLLRKRANLKKQSSDNRGALEDLNAAIQRTPAQQKKELADDRFQRGVIFYALKDWPQALQEFESLLAVTPDNWSAHQWRGEVLFHLDRIDEAVEAMDKFQAKGTPNPLATRVRGQCRAKLHNYQGAIEDFTLSLQIDRIQGKGVDAQTLNQRAWSYLLMDSPKLAKQDFDEALKLTGTHKADSFAGRGYARVLQGQWREGVEDVEAALKEEEPEERTLLNVARVYARATTQVNWQEIFKSNSKYARPEDSLRGDRAEREQVVNQVWQSQVKEQELRVRYRELGAKMLKLACDKNPPDKQAQFWNELIDSDPVLKPLHSAEEYSRLARKFGGTQNK